LHDEWAGGAAGPAPAGLIRTKRGMVSADPLPENGMSAAGRGQGEDQKSMDQLRRFRGAMSMIIDACGAGKGAIGGFAETGIQEMRKLSPR